MGGAIRMTRLALPLLTAAPQAAIVFVSSAVALAAVPDLAVYAATKAGVHSLARSLRAELSGTAVRVRWGASIPWACRSHRSHPQSAARVSRGLSFREPTASRKPFRDPAGDLAGDRVVGVNAGTIATQCYATGLLDQVWIDLVPVILGGGRPLFLRRGGRTGHARRPLAEIAEGYRRHPPPLRRAAAGLMVMPRPAVPTFSHRIAQRSTP